MIRFYILSLVVSAILIYLLPNDEPVTPTYVRKLNTIAYMKKDSTAVIIIDTSTIDGVFMYRVATKNENGDLIYLLIPSDLIY